MKRTVVLLVVLLASCESVGDVIPVGSDTYTVSARMNGQIPFPAWSQVKALGLKRANEFCGANNMKMQVVDWKTHGARGWTPLDAELFFKCM